MYYNTNPMGVLLVLPNLVYLSIIDIKYREVNNSELFPCLLIGIFTTVSTIITKGLEIRGLGFFLIGITLTLSLYYGGFLGGADVKLISILTLVYDPTMRYGITSNLDCIQLLYYFLILVLIFHLFRIVHNLFTVYSIGYLRPPLLNIWEMGFLCVFYRLKKISKIKATHYIILNFNSKDISIQLSQMGLICWLNQRIPMVPFITGSLLLTIFT